MFELALALIVEKRLSQVRKGYDAAHDDTHTDGELAKAGAAFALSSTCYEADNTTRSSLKLKRCIPGANNIMPGELWPWDNGWLPDNRKEDLVNGIACLVAELERLLRMEQDADVPELPTPYGTCEKEDCRQITGSLNPPVCARDDCPGRPRERGEN